MILSCGCKSDHEGIFCEWDAYSRECQNAVAYGCICALCYIALNARPTDQFRCNGFCGEQECKENQSKCKRKVQNETTQA